MCRDRLVPTFLTVPTICCLLLLGCGSGGSTSNNPPGDNTPGDNTPTAITGRVLTPDGVLGVAIRSSRQTATGGVTVALGQVDDDGTVVTVFNGARGLTDANGQFSINLPSGAKLGPSLNVIVGDGADPLLAGICVSATTDLTIPGTAAREALYAAARQNGQKVSELNSTQVKAFLDAANTAAGPPSAGVGLETAVNTASDKIGQSTTAGDKLEACVPRRSSLYVSSVSPASGHKDLDTVVVPITIKGGGFNSMTRLIADPTTAPVAPIYEPLSVSANQMKGQVIIQPGATVGRHTLYVVQLTHGGRQGLFGERVGFQFKVLPPAADIDVQGLLPDNIRLTNTDQTLEAFVNIGGEGFTKGTRVTIQSPLKIKEVNYFKSTVVTAVVLIPPTTTPGKYTMTVSGNLGEKKWDLTILPHSDIQERPVVNAISPANGQIGETVTVTLNGSGFEGTPNIIVTPNGVAVTSLVSASFGQIKATFQVMGIAAPGSRKVIVQIGNQFSEPIPFLVEP